jgi:asparagine synthase (glutamine-hydrolysing)
MKLAGRSGKHLLRKAAQERVPRFVLERKKKGFGTPTAAWLRTGLHEILRDALFSPRAFARNRFDLRLIGELCEAHRRGRDLSAELWPLLVLELWHRNLKERVRPRPSAIPPLPPLREVA